MKIDADKENNFFKKRGEGGRVGTWHSCGWLITGRVHGELAHKSGGWQQRPSVDSAKPLRETSSWLGAQGEGWGTGLERTAADSTARGVLSCIGERLPLAPPSRTGPGNSCDPGSGRPAGPGARTTCQGLALHLQPLLESARAQVQRDSLRDIAIH